MSHIPNTAMPHAGPQVDSETEDQGSGSESRFGQLAEKVREHPKTAAAVGVAAVGLAAAAAIPAIRGRGRGGGKSARGKSSD